jgi:DNA polymerase-1
LLDHSAFIHRAYHALPKLATSGGVACGAVYGLCDSLLWMTRARQFEATHWVAVGDAGRSGRVQIDPEYKNNRSERDDDLISQFPLADRACEALGIPVVRVMGQEADDVIAGLTEAFVAEGGEVLILSEDKDLMALIRPGVTQYRPVERKFYGEAEAFAKWGVMPDRISEALALQGDVADNIPGVPKVGPKTAANLINAYPTFAQMIAACKEAALAAHPTVLDPDFPISQLKGKSAIIARIARMEKRLLLNLELTKLRPDCLPGKFDFATIANQERDYRKVFDFFEELEFEQLIEKIETVAA